MIPKEIVSTCRTLSRRCSKDQQNSFKYMIESCDPYSFSIRDVTGLYSCMAKQPFMSWNNQHFSRFFNVFSNKISLMNEIDISILLDTLSRRSLIPSDFMEDVIQYIFIKRLTEVKGQGLSMILRGFSRQQYMFSVIEWVHICDLILKTSSDMSPQQISVTLQALSDLKYPKFIKSEVCPHLVKELMTKIDSFETRNDASECLIQPILNACLATSQMQSNNLSEELALQLKKHILHHFSRNSIDSAQSELTATHKFLQKEQSISMCISALARSNVRCEITIGFLCQSLNPFIKKNQILSRHAANTLLNLSKLDLGPQSISSSITWNLLAEKCTASDPDFNAPTCEPEQVTTAWAILLATRVEPQIVFSNNPHIVPSLFRMLSLDKNEDLWSSILSSLSKAQIEVSLLSEQILHENTNENEENISSLNYLPLSILKKISMDSPALFLRSGSYGDSCDQQVALLVGREVDEVKNTLKKIDSELNIVSSAICLPYSIDLVFLNKGYSTIL